ncbi:trimeric intracellular cation channel type 1B.1-like [Lepeophtheirus salmonis]
MIPNLPLRLYPLFEICDAASVSLKLKREHGHRVNIFALWSATIFNCHAGNLLTHILLGKPTINAFSNVEYIALVTLVFFSILLCPRNMIDTLLQVTPIHVFLIMVCEIFRSYKILKGINEGQKEYPGTLWPSIIIGSIRGNGSGWMKPVRSIILSDPSSFFKGEWFAPSRASQIAIVSAVLLTICKQDGSIFVSLVGLLISVAFTDAFPN